MNLDLFKNQIRFKIALELIDRDKGLSIMQLNKLLSDVPQATLYRHVNAMLKDSLLKVVGIQRVGKVEEKIYALNTSGYKIKEEDWASATYDEKVNFVSFYFMYILQKYKNYHDKLTTTDSPDKATFSLVKLNLSDEIFHSFQSELGTLLEKYYELSTKKEEDETKRTVSLVIIP
ncbi:hypothetical protein [Exiguobacterium antarcticum]|uniref:hypothetical protein n=1 Tax=Exiguobacterium antarcticum TaxID=132920 RepID=UPI00047CD44B|nr:hypothetical protein [Exiguobacterium antarcticum]